MKKVQHLNLILILFLCSFSAYAQQEPVDLQMIEKIKDEGLNRSQVMKTAFYLTDVIGPRLSGSAGLKKPMNGPISSYKTGN